MKGALVWALISALSLTASAQTGKVYTYAGDKPIVTHSSYRAETCDLAMKLYNPLLTGKKVTHIRVLTAPQAQPSQDYKVWLSSELKLEKNSEGKKVNAPDIVTVDCTPDAEGWLNVELPEPYTLTAKGVYVGYSFTITSYNDEGGRPIPYSQDRHADGFWFHGSKSAIKWMDYESRLQGVLPIYVTVEGDFHEYELSALRWATDYPYVQSDREFTLPLSVMNMGDKPVSEVSYTCIGPNGSELTKTVRLLNPIQPDIVNPKKLNVSIPALSELGVQEVSLRLDKVDGMPNASEYSQVTLSVESRALVPETRVVLEEATGTWCSACPRGAVAIEVLSEQFGSRFIGVAYHKGKDPMDTGCEPPADFTSFPSAVLNRGEIIDPYYGDVKGQNKPLGILPLVEAALEMPAPAAIDVKSEWTDATRTTLRATATVAFTGETSAEGHSVVFILRADGLKGEGKHWEQYNGLGHGDPSSVTDEYLRPMAERGNPIKDMEYDHVALLCDAPSQAHPLPASIQPTVPVSLTREFNPEEAVSVYSQTKGQQLVHDKDKLSVVAILLDKQGGVVNAAQAPAGSNSAVSIASAILSDRPVIATEYYDLSGRLLKSPQTGVNIRLELHSDGTTTATKLIK